MLRPGMILLRAKGLPILKQLHLEERLLRTTSHNVCIVNDGTPSPSIVMGISGKPKELLQVDSVLRDDIPVIKRFSGGGTVIVDSDTVFVTIICNKGAVPNLQQFPRPIMAWTEQLYSSVFDSFPNFRLREHDYVLGDRKFGGNAQSITKNRWLHHTSFLWDYKSENMAYLKLPARAPTYRSARSHDEFLCSLKDVVNSRPLFLEKVVSGLSSWFDIKEEQIEKFLESQNVQHNCSTKTLSVNDLKDQEVATFISHENIV